MLGRWRRCCAAAGLLVTCEIMPRRPEVPSAAGVPPLDEVPTLTGDARKKLATPAPGEGQMTYDDLLPQALRLMETPGPPA